MDGGADGGSEARFAAYVEQLGRVLGHADRREPLHDYCLGLVMPIERKSVEPMAALTAPAQVAAKHQYPAFPQSAQLPLSGNNFSGYFDIDTRQRFSESFLSAKRVK